MDSERIHKVPVHARRFARRTNVDPREYSGQHDAVFFTGAGSCGVYGDEGIKGASVRIALCQQA